jgi:TonB family protein
MIMDKLLISLFALVLTSYSFAQNEDFDELALNGLAAYEQLRKEYYIGAIYLESISQSPGGIITMDGKKRMEMRITVKKWSPRRFAQQWNQALLINNDQETLNEFANQIQSFSGLPKEDLIAGDQILIDMTPGLGVTVYLNHQQAFTTRKTGFFDLLVGTWIGMRPPSSEFKSSILTLPTDQAGTELLHRYDAIEPSKARSTTVANWFKKEAPSTAKTGTQKTSAGGDAPTRTTTTASTSIAAVVLAKPKAPVIETTVQKPVITSAQLAPPSSTTAAKAPVNAKPKAVPAKPKPAEKTEAEKLAEKEAVIAKQVKLLKNYRDSVMKLTYINTEYPKRALKKRWEGLVVLKVTLDRQGKVLSIKEEQAAKRSTLNDAAKKAVKKSAPYPAAPKELIGDDVVLLLPFNFKL